MNMGAKVVTFGCRLNAFESEVISRNSSNIENTIIFNTCAVTAEAERQARQAIRRKRRENPNARIIVTGCAAQIKPEIWIAMQEVDAVVGNEEKLRRGVFDEGCPEIQVDDIMKVSQTAGHLPRRFSSRNRVFLQIQNGCDHDCTFCIIPSARGKSRSVALEDIIADAINLTESGYSEIVLTGVDIGDYGKDLSELSSLGDLVKRLLDSVPKLLRLRLSSIDPVEVDDLLFLQIANERRLMPHFHFSLQAGDDLILKRMKRRHSRRDIIDVCNHIRTIREDAVIGGDLIAGFPTETEEMFHNTLELVYECNLTMLHIFPYSIRKGTPAAEMPQVHPKVIRDRAKMLRTAGASIRKKVFQQFVGRQVEVLVENDSRGHTEHFIPIEFAQRHSSGKIVQAEVLTASSGGLTGVVLGG